VEVVEFQTLQELQVDRVAVLGMVQREHHLVDLEMFQLYHRHKELLVEILLHLIQLVVVEEQEVQVNLLVHHHQLVAQVVQVRLLLVVILDYLVLMECLDLLLDVGLLVVELAAEILVLILQHLVAAAAEEMGVVKVILDLLEKLILDLVGVVEAMAVWDRQVVLEL
jgi:hypothetical protein